MEKKFGELNVDVPITKVALVCSTFWSTRRGDHLTAFDKETSSESMHAND